MDIPYTTKIRPDTGVYNAKLGVWLFLASEIMLFGGLFSAYIFLRVGAPVWPVRCSSLRKPAKPNGRRRGASGARPSFRARRASVAMDLKANRMALSRLTAARHRLEARKARTDMREWQVKRRERTRQLIELGGLVVKAGLERFSIMLHRSRRRRSSWRILGVSRGRGYGLW